MTNDEQVEALSLDLLAESINLGLGHVIEELSEISGSRIVLHVPKASMIPKDEALTITQAMRRDGKAIFVRQQFSGDIDGEAVLFFSEKESLNLLNGLLPDNDEQRLEFAATEEEMLLDLTNVAVSGVIYALSSLLSIRLTTELPDCEYGTFDELTQETDLLSNADERILLLTIAFTVVAKNATAQLMFFQPKNTLVKLYDHIRTRMNL
ncbi:hypothetical protein ACQUQU_11835 [Thalassolituus sp. LLYu03]|uniref:hypothetical protein n=1 Tax=Thalassolituus sp. LLYu03 TaxID=3421656 RepID=UPI003D2D9E57